MLSSVTVDVSVCVGGGTLYECLYGQLKSGMRLPGGPVRRYKDTLKINLKRCGINPNLINSAALSRSSWRSECHQAIGKFEETSLERKRAARK